jgi:hypothetical protein
MKSYVVSIPIAGTMNISVVAKSKDEAKSAAWAAYGESGADAGEVTWEAHERLTTGNVLHAAQNEIEVSDG